MIERIEILRDGAAAQYGSDAIAGVLNIVLKKDAGGEIRATAGQTYTTYNKADGGRTFTDLTGPVEARDGKVFQLALDYGWTFGSNAFLHVATSTLRLPPHHSLGHRRCIGGPRCTRRGEGMAAMKTRLESDTVT